MPWRLIVSIVVFAIFLTFITFNLDNRCDINLGFAKFSNVPVFLTVFTSFVFGLLCALPIAYRLKGMRKGQEKFWKRKKTETQTGHTNGGSDETD
jgi:uncharacterized integral membrane protein